MAFDSELAEAVSELRDLRLRLREMEFELDRAKVSPVTGDRLLASLACHIDHIDHDEPPGLAARELATVVLELLDGADGVEAVILAAKLRGLVEQRKAGT